MNLPAVEVENCYGIREVSIYTEHLARRKIFIEGMITMETADAFVLQMMHLKEESEEDIYLYINSYGGDINSGLLIYDVIQGIKIPLHITCIGMAASMAAVILAGGQKGRRHILPHSQTMIHEPLLSQGVGGSASSIKNISDSILRTRDILNEILAKHTGKPLQEINDATSFNHYMTAEESVAFGLCDSIVESL